MKYCTYIMQTLAERAGDSNWLSYPNSSHGGATNRINIRQIGFADWSNCEDVIKMLTFGRRLS